jgi:hypothetical protein
MVAELKRSCSFLAELLAEDPHQMKRLRGVFDLEDAALPPDVETALASAVNMVASAASASSPDASDVHDTGAPCGTSVAATIRGNSRRNHESMDDCDVDTELPWERPIDKRRRQDDDDPNSAASLRPWTQKLVTALHGCPSVEAALQRCEPVLRDFGAELREREQSRAAASAAADAAAKEASSGSRGTPCSEQGLQYENRILKRAVLHLADRCRHKEANATANAKEVAVLRQAVEQAQESQRRLAHSNEMLQGHLRLQMNGVPRF